MRSAILFILISLFVSYNTCWAEAETIYGPEALSGVKPYGVEVRVVTSSEIQHHNQVIHSHIKNRLANRGIMVVNEGSVVLRLTMTAITSDDGFFVVHYLLECLQAAYLAKDSSPTEAPVWDAYRMGEFREQDILPTVDDLLRSFLNDYISVN